MNKPPPHQIVADEAGLVLSFQWHGDRYAHTVSCDNVIGLASEEGTAEQAWPPSPAIQQLSTETIGGTPTILGVGCCGTTHVSVSVQIENVPHQGPQHDSEQDRRSSPALRFDWAARLAKPLAPDDVEPAWLGSTYHQPCETALFEIIGLAADVPVLHKSLKIEPSQLIGSRTVQWSYRIRKRDE